MRKRLFLSFFIIVLVTVASVVLVAHQSAVNEVRGFMLRGGMSGLEELVQRLEAYYQENGSWAGVEALIAMPGSGQGRGQGHGQMMGPGMMMDQRLRLADAHGQVLVDTAGEQPPGQLSAAELGSALELRSGLRTVGYLVAEGGVNFSGSEEALLVGRLSRAALTAGLIAGGVSLLLALLLSEGLLRPIRHLTGAARGLGQGDLTRRVPAGGADELAVLGRTFNSMAESLQHAYDSRRAMTADIAHELRNPLAVQRAHLEALIDGVYPLDPENLAPILEQNLLLTRLVDDLRTLALADAGQLALETAPTDLQALVERVIERFQPQAAARQVSIALETPPARLPRLEVDPQRVEQILNNLLANALRYSPQGGAVRLSLAPGPQSVQLTIQDDGPGIPPEALPYIFDRFYRADRSRSRAEGGTGLGLAIARQLAQAHGGDLTAANGPTGGARFVLSLPAPDAAGAGLAAGAA